MSPLQSLYIVWEVYALKESKRRQPIIQNANLMPYFSIKEFTYGPLHSDILKLEKKYE